MEILYSYSVSNFCFFIKIVKCTFCFIFHRSWSQKQADAKKQVNQATASQAAASNNSSSSNQSQKFSYTAKNSTNAAATATASTTTVWDKAPKNNTAPPPATNAADEKWQAKLNSNVAGTQQNAQDFTKEFMGQMYGGSTQ